METLSRSRIADVEAGYGWLSIALHWLGAILVITLWILGSSIPGSGARYDETLHLHTSFAVAAYLVLLARVVWRFKVGHPGPNAAQRGWAFSVGTVAHCILLLAIVLMLLTGPLTAWLQAEPLHVFGFELPSPFERHPSVSDFMHRGHMIGANIIVVATLLHIAGALKHTAFNKDGTLERILIAGKPTSESKPESTSRSKE